MDRKGGSAGVGEGWVSGGALSFGNTAAVVCLAKNLCEILWTLNRRCSLDRNGGGVTVPPVTLLPILHS